jgi:polysaccharide export outer membrane protein
MCGFVLIATFASVLAFAQTTPAPQLAVATQNAPAPQLPASSVDSNYVIGPGDTLEVFVWRNPELSTRIPVRPDGKISTPLVEDMVAVGKSTSQLARDMESVLGKYVRTPQVNVIVVTALSAMSQVTVVGAAARPGALPYREGLRVLDAILAVGGLNEFAAGNRAKIVRQKGTKREEIHIKLKSLLDKGDLAQNVVLQPGDVVVIPESFF